MQLLLRVVIAVRDDYCKLHGYDTRTMTVQPADNKTSLGGKATYRCKHGYQMPLEHPVNETTESDTPLASARFEATRVCKLHNAIKGTMDYVHQCTGRCLVVFTLTFKDVCWFVSTVSIALESL